VDGPHYCIAFLDHLFFWNTVFAVGSVMVDLHGAISGYIVLPIALGYWF